MMAGERQPYNIAQLVEYHSKHCNRLVNGKCGTRRCLIRGGWNADYSVYERATFPVPDSYEHASCEAFETVSALRDLATTLPNL